MAFILLVLGSVFLYFTHNVIATFGFLLFVLFLSVAIFERMDF